MIHIECLVWSLLGDSLLCTISNKGWAPHFVSHNSYPVHWSIVLPSQNTFPLGPTRGHLTRKDP